MASRNALPLMLAQRKGQIINIAALGLALGFMRMERVMAKHAAQPFDLSRTEPSETKMMNICADHTHPEGQMRIRDAIKLIEADGWRLVSIKGSHRQFKHPLQPGRVTIAGKLDMDLHPKTLKSILKQAGIEDVLNG